MIVKIARIPDDVFAKLKIGIQNKNEPENPRLAGNLKEEFNISDTIPDLEPFLLGVLSSNEKLQHHFRFGGYKVNTGNHELRLNRLWVNYQKKHEFNPIHSHTGIFSFIIFVQIPFTSEEQRKLSPGAESNHDMAGRLEFLTYDATGKLDLTKIDADKTWEQSMLIFPAKLGHVVYPFYGTDEYRITISGNVGFKT